MPVCRACAVCGGDEHHRIPFSPRRGVPVTPVVCKSCGLVFLNPMSTYAEDMAEAKRSSVREMHRPVRCSRPMESAYRREMAKARLCMEMLQGVLAPDDDVLEVGAGDGSLLKLLGEHGARPVGNDMDPEGCRFVEDRLEVPMVMGAFEEVDFGSRRFDLVVSSHVIEHVFEPVEVLVQMRKLLKRGGHVFLETPNVLRPKVGPRRAFNRAHKYYFSPRTLSLALHRAGFRAMAVRQFNRFSFQVLAGIASAGELADAPAGDRWQDVLASIRRHALMYRISLQFLWRKIPVVKTRMIYRIYSDLKGDNLSQWLRRAA